ncbi:bifunctional oligoribonuclease/PAP phosphatase NrnA [Bacillaceae bacterium]
MDDYRQSLRAAAQFIREHDDFLVVSHVNPDGDATGSALAVAALLKEIGKGCTLVNEGETPQKFRFLPSAEHIRNYTENPPGRTYRAVIAVDAADLARLGKVVEIFHEDAKLLNIDHHSTNDRYGDVNLIKESACATAEIVYELLQEMGVSLSRDIAECLYTGLLTDTGGFRYANTNAYVLQIASELLQHGVSPAKIAERCLETITRAHLEMLKAALDTLTFEAGGLLAVLTVTKEVLAQTGAQKEDVEGFVNYARNIEGVEVGILFKEILEKEVKVSFRSRSYVDVAEIAKKLGGGGHVRASGCTLPMTLEEAKKTVIPEVLAALRKGAKGNGA